MSVEESFATPERPAEPAPEYSGWWRRVAAALVDSVIVGGAATLLLLLLTDFDYGDWVDGGSMWVITRWSDVVFYGTSAVLSVVYFVPLMTRWDGRTVGKRLVRIRVIKADWTPLDAGTVLVRQTLFQWILLTALTPLSVFDYFAPLVDRQNRALHDFLCSTRVIRDWPHR